VKKDFYKNTPGWVYRFFSKSGALLYIGSTGDLLYRISAHQGEKEWFSQVSRIDVCRYSDRHQAWAAESLAIARENPLFNVYGKCGEIT
jgi:predicted GIY-YIG superfamily endonuclease